LVQDLLREPVVVRQHGNIAERLKAKKTKSALSTLFNTAPGNLESAFAKHIPAAERTAVARSLLTAL